MGTNSRTLSALQDWHPHVRCAGNVTIFGSPLWDKGHVIGRITSPKDVCVLNLEPVNMLDHMTRGIKVAGDLEMGR